ncbi:hypothetical protein EJD97_002395 [Solanum chilense]|uniref:Integrase catalytic domain-containing protein n=1 Tax=Solanum chilense TaxID=4083 RepID=A0A6N2BZV0_SOLCI|nr:hypothetical protein EJD97_002395 [Solanum chilense]
MDFITGLPRTRRLHDSIWVIVNRMTKSSRFLEVKTTYSAEDYARLYINEIVRLRGVPLSIISNRGIWDDHLPHIEFAYKKSYNSCIQKAPYEALYGCRCRSHVGWFEVGEAALLGPDSVLYAIEEVQLVRDIFNTAQKSVAVKDSLSYEDVPVEILDRQVRRLRNKEVVSIKVLWRSQSVEGATSEAEAAMKAKYPHPFISDSTLS